jgi:predicted house-cleaning noncanonical NTP pyrophosphatase (MazG superfamily)
MIIHDKLVRDRIPEILAEKGVKYVIMTLNSDDEYRKALEDKVLEEAQEFIKNPSTEELADLMEVVETLLPFHPELKAVQRAKREARGGFSSRVYLVETE